MAKCGARFGGGGPARAGSFRLVALAVTALVLVATYEKCLVSAKSVEGTTLGPRSHLAADAKSKDTAETCETVRGYFDSMSVTFEPDNAQKGSVCGGQCCSNKTETELLKLATREFEAMLHHHTRSVRGVLHTTSETFQEHIINLLDQSEEKTLNVFSQVYRRMLPLSKELIGNLYTHIRSYFTAASDSEPDQHLQVFFYNLFPIAYHRAVHLNNGDLPEFYIECLKKSFDDLKPFGDIPKELSKSLTQSLDAGRLFIDVLQKAGEVLDEADKLDSLTLVPACRTHLLKMTYCKQCHGHAPSSVKACHGYCKNVIRGCLAQFLGVLDGPWSNVAEAIEAFVSSSIFSENGVISVIKGLDTKLSEAIMRAMQNGPDLEKKIKKACGTPELLPAKNESSGEPRSTQTSPAKWSTPPDPQFINFLSTIEKSRYFYSKTGDNLCEEGEYQRSEQHCWTGDSIGDYTNEVLPIGMDSQRYNPEIPLTTQPAYSEAARVNTLVDRLIKLRSMIVNTLPSNSRSYSDIQSDMARHDEEGSGTRVDEFDDDDTAGSGSGSGELTPPPFDGAVSPTSPSSRSETTGSSPSLTSFISVLQILVVYAIVSFLSH